MPKNKQNRKGFKVMAAITLIGIIISSTIPSALAATDEGSSATESNNGQNQSNLLLSKLEIEGIQLDEALSPDLFNYSATVENDVKEISLIVESENPEAAIAINGETPKNIDTHTYSLQTGENKFTIALNDGIHPTSTYTLTVTRKQNSDNTLKGITLSKGELSPKFDPTVMDYSVQVGNEVEGLTISAKAAEDASTIEINNTPLNEDGTTIQLPIGQSDVSLLVTAENGDEKSYILHVVRAEKPIDESSTPPKIPNQNTQNNETNNKSSSKQNSSHVSGSTKPQGAFSATRGSSSQGLSQGAQGSNTQFSTAAEKVSFAALSSMTVSDGTWDSDFSSDEYTYHIAIPDNVTSVTLNPIAKYSSSAILIEGKTDKSIQLTENKTVISVLVTRGEDRKTYVLVLDKPAAQAAAETEIPQQPSESNTSSVSEKDSKTPKLLAASIRKYEQK